MVSLGLVLLVVGLIVVAAAYVLRGPAIAARLGWVCFGAGALFLIVGLLIPVADDDVYQPHVGAGSY